MDDTVTAKAREIMFTQENRLRKSDTQRPGV